MNPNYEAVQKAITESGLTLKEWLKTPALPEELSPLPLDKTKNYLPIDEVRKKFELMQDVFGAVVEQVDVSAGAINCIDTKDTAFWACVKFIVHHDDFKGGKKIFCGTASFLKGQYASGWAFTQIAESLATTRAFSKEFEQFGKGLNKEIESIENLKSPKGKEVKDPIKNTLKDI